jgi:hypothetical protein
MRLAISLWYNVGQTKGVFVADERGCIIAHFELGTLHRDEKRPIPEFLSNEFGEYGIHLNSFKSTRYAT